MGDHHDNGRGEEEGKELHEFANIKGFRSLLGSHSRIAGDSVSLGRRGGIAICRGIVGVSRGGVSIGRGTVGILGLLFGGTVGVSLRGVVGRSSRGAVGRGRGHIVGRSSGGAVSLGSGGVEGNGSRGVGVAVRRMRSAIGVCRGTVGAFWCSVTISMGGGVVGMVERMVPAGTLGTLSSHAGSIN